MSKQGAVILYFDPESFSAESEGRELTPDELNKIGKQINDEIAAFYNGYGAWETKFVEV